MKNSYKKKQYSPHSNREHLQRKYRIVIVSKMKYMRNEVLVT